MKKFLSILLAVMMILSTVSFAAPSLAGSADVAVEETPVVEVPAAEADEAVLAAEVNKASYGTLIYKVDFENDNFDVDGFSTAYKQLKDGTTASYINPAFDTSNVTCYTNAAFLNDIAYNRMTSFVICNNLSFLGCKFLTCVNQSICFRKRCFYQVIHFNFFGALATCCKCGKINYRIDRGA